MRYCQIYLSGLRYLTKSGDGRISTRDMGTRCDRRQIWGFTSRFESILAVLARPLKPSWQPNLDISSITDNNTRCQSSPPLFITSTISRGKTVKWFLLYQPPLRPVRRRRGSRHWRERRRPMSVIVYVTITIEVLTTWSISSLTARKTTADAIAICPIKSRLWLGT